MPDRTLNASWRIGGIAHIARRRGAPAPDLGAPWPTPGQLTEGAALKLANVAPDAALAISATSHANWVDDLRAKIDVAAIVTDQSGAYKILRLEGAAARDLLASGVFIDLDPDAFPAGSAAALRCGHIAVTLLYGADGAFEILVPRSYAGSFQHWLQTSARMRGASLNGI